MTKYNIGSFISAFLFFLMGLLGAVFAYFTVSAISTNNIFRTGGMEVVLFDNNETESVVVSDSWSADNLMPGTQLPESRIEVFNKSTVDADHVDVEFSYTGSEDVAKNFLFSPANNGFRYGSSSDGSSVNLITALKGGSDTDYIVTQGWNGEPFSSGTVDGVDGSEKDGKISLHELATFGKIRIQRGDERGGIAAGTAADLWLNAMMGDGLAAQNESIDVQITFSVDQDASQY